MEARPELMITHAPGHMFLTDLPSRGLHRGPLRPEGEA